MFNVRRREFITLIGGAAAWPLAQQQPGKPPTIGFMGSTTPQVAAQWIAAFVQRLRELGWLESRDVAIQYRWGRGAQRQRRSSTRRTAVGVSTGPPPETQRFKRCG
jgi:putative tryptophan/tyrosine transport system substrate-binding protein